MLRRLPSAVALLAAALLLVLGARAVPAQELRVEPSGAKGVLRLQATGDGGAIFRLERLVPGDRGEGTITVTNPDSGRVPLSLRTGRLLEVPGDAGGRLSEAVELRVLEGDELRWGGTLADLRTATFGTIDGGATRTFRFVVELPDAGEPPTPSTGDNALMGSAFESDYVFSVERQDEQAVAGAVSSAPPAATVVPVTPGRVTCGSRRRFDIRLRVDRRRVRSAKVWVDGRAVRVQPRGGRLTATVDLRTRLRGRTKVDIAVVLRDGRRLTGTRRYRTCETKKLRGARKPAL